MKKIISFLFLFLIGVAAGWFANLYFSKNSADWLSADRLASELHLSGPEKQELKDLEKSFIETRNQITTDLKKRKDRLRELIVKSDTLPDQIHAQEDLVLAQKERLEHAKVDYILSIKESLPANKKNNFLKWVQLKQKV